jgi:hypothetical protein
MHLLILKAIRTKLTFLLEKRRRRRYANVLDVRFGLSSALVIPASAVQMNPRGNRLRLKRFQMSQLSRLADPNGRTNAMQLDVPRKCASV